MLKNKDTESTTSEEEEGYDDNREAELMIENPCEMFN